MLKLFITTAVLTGMGETVGTEIEKRENVPQNFTQISEQMVHFLHCQNLPKPYFQMLAGL